MRKDKKALIAVGAIICIGAFLRFYRLRENLIFHGELGVDYLAVRDIIEGKRTALLGPRTSHEWLYLAPLFYWIMVLLLPLFNYNPAVGAYFFAVIGVSTIYLCYRVVSHFLGRQTGLLSSYLLAISPAWIRLTRDARFNVIAALLFSPFLYFLVKSIDNRGKGLFWLGLILGLSYSFFPTIIVLLPSVLVLLFLKRRKVKLKSLWNGLIGLIIPLLPFLIYNIQNKFDMIFKIVAWVPYRIAGFFGFYPKNTASLEIIKANFVSLYTFFWESFVPQNNLFVLLLFMAVLTYSVYRAKKRIVSEKSIFWLAISIVFLVTFAGLFLHGDPPKHYYLAIFPIPLVLLADFMSEISRKKIGLVISISILTILTIVNLKYYFSEKWFYQPEDYTQGTLPVPFTFQEKIVDKIIAASAGREFKLKRVGALDYFEADFSQNYIYLLRIRGREPVDKANLSYTIYENTENLALHDFFWVGNIAILEEDNF